MYNALCNHKIDLVWEIQGGWGVNQTAQFFRIANDLAGVRVTVGPRASIVEKPIHVVACLAG